MATKTLHSLMSMTAQMSTVSVSVAAKTVGSRTNSGSGLTSGTTFLSTGHHLPPCLSKPWPADDRLDREDDRERTRFGGSPGVGSFSLSGNGQRVGTSQQSYWPRAAY